MPITLAFDVYGTLIDTAGVVQSLEKLIGDRAALFSAHWRAKQLEYSFRRGLMQNYQDFSVCTRQALDHTCALLGTEISPEDRTGLLATYRTLPAFDDAKQGLEWLQKANFRLYAFSNGRPDDVANLLAHAKIDHFFSGVVSTDELRSFKPNPGVYAHFMRRSGTTGAEAWLISGNPFDVIGAISAGMRGAWVKRSPKAVYDPWGIEPTVTVGNLAELYTVLEGK
jgi:2-haloacid dehalogenase